MSNETERKSEKTGVKQDDAVFEVGKPVVKSYTGNPLYGIGAGVLAAIAGCVIWILLSHFSKLTWIGLIFAFGIASAIKYAGRPTAMWYGIAGASLSLMLSLIGNLSTAVHLYSQRYHKSAIEILSQDYFTYAFSLLGAISSPLDYLMYIAVIVIGFRFSFTPMPKELP